MRSLKKFICVFLSVLIVCSCMVTVAFANDSHTEHNVCHPSPVIGSTGTFNALNYDVNGYPIDVGDIWGNAILVGRMLNTLDYGIVAIQDNFSYDAYLRREMTNYANVTYKDDSGIFGGLFAEEEIVERHQSENSGDIPVGDGLDIFTKYNMYDDARVKWKESLDYTSEKGIEVTTIELAKGYYLDVYNIHADEGPEAAVVNKRQAQFTQLANYILKHSIYDESTGTYDHAVLVTGNFGASIYNETSLVKNLLEAAHLNDAWAVKNIDGVKADSGSYKAYYDYAAATNMTREESFGKKDSIERFCYASGNGIEITCTDFRYEFLYDLDTGNLSLSEHAAVFADFSWEIVEKAHDFGYDHTDKDVTQNQSNILFVFLNYIASIFRTIGRWFQNLQLG